jgi:sulfur-oxidizing protein SoxX
MKLSHEKPIAGAASTAVLALCMLALVPTVASSAEAGDPEAGKKVAMDRTKGNCIACHMLPGGESPGAIGPALVAMQARYPDKEKLRAQIYDATVANPASSMPPFGKHEILTEQEFNDIVAYIWSI